MDKYSGFIDPSFYAVIINAKECGWVPRPPSISLTNSSQTLSELKQTSSHVSEDGRLDLRFSTSLHERKHFLDLHLSRTLWRSFLSWFNCYSQIFSITPLLKGKKINVPLYTNLGSLREDNLFNHQEQELINNICNGIFSNHQHQRLKYALEASASLLQYSFLKENYYIDDNEESTSARYYELFYRKPFEEFSGSIARAFCCYTFLSWFCSDFQEFGDIEKLFQVNTDYRKLANDLLKEKYFALKQEEIKNDALYLDAFSKYFNRPDTKHFPDLTKYLSELINFRKEQFSTIEHILKLLTDLTYFNKWLANDALKTYYLVDFGKPLSPETEITENYFASKWIVENSQYLFYDDHLGKRILTNNELDDLINIQLLSSFLISPFRLFPFRTKIASSDFLECDLLF
ncbi:MAG: hypothetical protein KAR42_04805 [candidate division Zixibacteria bacterium]|nr:hypothetical protein [candidate division Zixibacteria bacterium]